MHAASDGHEFLAVWNDERASGAIVGTRLSASGEVLDQNGIVISSRLGGSPTSVPIVSWGGDAYVVVYREMFAARVALDGTVLQSGVRLEQPVSRIAQPSEIASIWNRHLIAWNAFAFREPTEYHLSLYDGSLQKIRDVSSTRVDALASDGQRFLAVTATGGRLDLSIVDSEGAVAKSVSLDAPEAVQGVTASFNGSRFVVAWTDSLAVRVITVDVDLAVSGMRTIDPRGPMAAIDSTSTYAQTLLTWQRDTYSDEAGVTTDIVAVRIGADASPLESQPVIVTAAPLSQNFPAAASNGSAYLIAYDDGRLGYQSDVMASFFPRGAAPGSEFLLATGPAEQVAPAITAFGEGFAMVFDERPNGTNDATAGVRLVSWNRARGAKSIAQGLPGSSFGAAIAGAADRLLLSWRQGNAPVVTAAGTETGVASPGILSGAFGFDRPSVASSGSTFLVAWEQGDNPPQGSVALFDRFGTQIGPAVSAGDARQIAVAFDGTNYVVMTTLFSETGAELRIRRYSTALMPVDPSPVVIDSVLLGWIEAPVIACKEGSCIVAWERIGQDADVWACVIRPGDASSQTQAFLVAGGGGNQETPAVTALPDRTFAVAWADAAAGDVRAAWVTESGVSVEQSVAVSAVREWAPAISASGDGREVVVLWLQEIPPGDRLGLGTQVFMRTIANVARERGARR